MTILFSSGIENLHYVNESFDAGELWVAYHGENKNKTYIPKEAFEEAIPSIYNCPIVCNYTRATDSIGSHDVSLVAKDGKVRMVNITQPVGVIPESATYRWKTVEENDGTEHEYLCIDFLLWKRQEAYEHIKDRGFVDESMEIRIKSGSRHDDGIYYIDSFEFLAFCLLESAAPCFESAHIELFAKNEFKEQYVQMMAECKQAFAAMNASSAEADYSTEGGNDKMNGSEMNSVETQEENTPVEDQPIGTAQFEADGETGDETGDEAGQDEAGQEQEGEQNDGAAEGEDEPEDDGDDDTANSNSQRQQFSLTADQQRHEIVQALHAETYDDPCWGRTERYAYCDHDNDLGEIYAYEFPTWNIVGLKFTMDGDKVVIDWQSAKRKKLVYVDFEDGEQGQPYSGIAEVFAAAYAAQTQAKDAELDELRAFKKEAVKKDLKAQAEQVFAAFADLEGNDAFETLKTSVVESGYELYAENLEEKCYAIRGRCATATFALNQGAQSTRLPIDGMSHIDADKGDPNEPYNGVFKKFHIN